MLERQSSTTFQFQLTYTKKETHPKLNKDDQLRINRSKRRRIKRDDVKQRALYRSIIRNDGGRRNEIDDDGGDDDEKKRLLCK